MELVGALYNLALSEGWEDIISDIHNLPLTESDRAVVNIIGTREPAITQDDYVKIQAKFRAVYN